MSRRGVVTPQRLNAMSLTLERNREWWTSGSIPRTGQRIEFGVVDSRKGAQAWFAVGPFQFQPSEIAKLSVIIAIAGYCHQHRGDLDAWRVAVVLGLAGLVMGIVYAQNDLGTMLVIMVCTISMLVAAQS